MILSAVWPHWIPQLHHYFEGACQRTQRRFGVVFADSGNHSTSASFEVGAGDCDGVIAWHSLAQAQFSAKPETLSYMGAHPYPTEPLL